MALLSHEERPNARALPGCPTMCRAVAVAHRSKTVSIEKRIQFRRWLPNPHSQTLAGYKRQPVEVNRPGTPQKRRCGKKLLPCRVAFTDDRVRVRSALVERRGYTSMGCRNGSPADGHLSFVPVADNWTEPIIRNRRCHQGLPVQSYRCDLFARHFPAGVPAVKGSVRWNPGIRLP